MLARRLIKPDVRFFEIQFGGCDTHVGNFDTVAWTCPEVDAAVTALPLNGLGYSAKRSSR